MEWIGSIIPWYIALLIIGVIFTPTARFLFRNSPDRGYPLAKTIGIIVLTYSTFILGTLHISPFTTYELYGILAVSAAFNYWIYKRFKLTHTHEVDFKVILYEEILFWICLVALAYMRGQEPSIHGLEKFMDYGFMNSILRSTYFPPRDMWSTPLPINYYYFGHMSGAVLTRLTQLPWAVGYNLILATIFAQGMTCAFSLSTIITSHVAHHMKHPTITRFRTIVFGMLGAVLVNTIGNLHTIYLFTKGYPNETPIPFWTIFSWYNPEKYWYPNATRFIPYTIHEFPSYSYVVADLHGHVFDIPFVLLTLALLYIFFTSSFPHIIDVIASVKKPKKSRSKSSAAVTKPPRASHQQPHITPIFTSYVWAVLFGFMLAVHYMTNAFDGPIYYLLLAICYAFVYKLTRRLLYSLVTTAAAFVAFSWPFSAHFKPFASGIGVNCSPQFLVKMAKLGPFLFEKGNCQVSPPWMLFVLWGFFFISMCLYIYVLYQATDQEHVSKNYLMPTDLLILIVYFFSFALLLIPEFFYVKDIYPQHFRANTMFKLGYQAFMMMGIASMYTFYRISSLKSASRYMIKIFFLLFFSLVFVYPFFSVPSYYGKMDKKPELNGALWLRTSLPQDAELVDYLNSRVQGQPVILEAQGDSYTDYERISSYTGLPTVAGWWVHEWLWRGNADVVGSRIPDINTLYESPDLERTRALIHQYNIRYVVVSGLEREKYKSLNEKKFEQIGHLVYRSSNGVGALYQVD